MREPMDRGPEPARECAGEERRKHRSWWLKRLGIALLTVLVLWGVSLATGARGSVRAASGPTRTALQSPAPSSLELAATDHQVEPVENRATITGQVRVRGGGAAPAGIPVRAWRIDGPGYAQTRTTAASPYAPDSPYDPEPPYGEEQSGFYQMKVVSGTWAIQAMPLPNQPYAIGEFPRLVLVTTDTTTVTQDLLIIETEANITIHGQTVEKDTGEPLTDGVYGHAYAWYYDPQMRLSVPILGPVVPIRSGVFTMSLSSSAAPTYTIGVKFPPRVPYTAVSQVTVPVEGSGPLSVTIPIVRNNSHIQGVLLDSANQVVTSQEALVWATSNHGGLAHTWVNPDDGSYDLAVASMDKGGKGGSTWRVRLFLSPHGDYIVKLPRMHKVFVEYRGGEGTTVSGVDFHLIGRDTLGQIDGHVTGPASLLAPGGTPMALIPVVAREVSDSTNGDEPPFVRWSLTGLDGHYRLTVPAGTYRVYAHSSNLLRRMFGLPSLIDPAPAMVSVNEQGQETADLQFREPDVQAEGQVVYASDPYQAEGLPHAALVRARSSDGVRVHAVAGEDGQYQLALKGGLTWEIVAVSSDGDAFFMSRPVTIQPVASPVPVVVDDLVLRKVGTLPDRQAFVFDAATDQTLTLSDGSQIQLPAGTLADSGTVVLTVEPLPELFSSGGAEPVSFGYRLRTYTDTGIPIWRMMQPVTLILPFAAEQLTELGITMDQLVPASWDSTNQSWVPLENVIVTPDDQGGGTVTITIEPFGESSSLQEGTTGTSDAGLAQSETGMSDFALTFEPEGTANEPTDDQSLIYLPLISR
ncbi:MAG: hypothetical protein HC884_11310 [Chloroflexaceae bacterium]|nr:hypothetical protein [Chloroflexaceae bacterium]